jgi:hypothetical protein
MQLDKKKIKTVTKYRPKAEISDDDDDDDKY